MMSKFNLQFENTFKIATLTLRINNSHPDGARNWHWKIKITIIMMLCISSALFLCYSLFLHDIPNRRYVEASKTGIMVIVCCTITLKYLILLYHRESIKTLIEIIDEDYKVAEQFSEEEQGVILKYSRKGVTVCKFWLVTSITTGAVFPMKAFVLMFYHYWQGDFKLVPVFALTCPPFLETFKDFLPVFIMIFCICLLFDCLAAAAHIGFDPLVPIYMLHTCGQLEILSVRTIKSFSEVDNPRMIEKELKSIVLKHQQLYRFVKCVQSNFMVLYEYNMKATTFLLPLAAFQILEDLRNGRLNIEFTSFFAGCVLHFYMPCYYSDLLMEKSERFRQAIYSCGWEKQPDKAVRKMVMFMMTRAMVPLGITTIFYPICLDTFAEMCRQSYAIFNLMNAVWA